MDNAREQARRFESLFLLKPEDRSICKLVNELSRKDQISDRAKWLARNCTLMPPFWPDRELELVVATPQTLGISGCPTLQQIYKSAFYFNLDLCCPQTALRVRIESRDPRQLCEGKHIFIAMAPIISDGSHKIFCIAKAEQGDDILLDAHPVGRGGHVGNSRIYPPTSRWIFVQC